MRPRDMIPTAADPEVIGAAMRLRTALLGGHSNATVEALHDLKLAAGKRERLLLAGDTGVPPINILLFCPACGRHHIDAPEPGTSWSNPPHRTHRCAGCGEHWRPSDVATNGIAAIESRGSTDTWSLGDRDTVAKAQP